MRSCLIWQPCMWQAPAAVPWTWTSGRMSVASASGSATCSSAPDLSAEHIIQGGAVWSGYLHMCNG